MSAAAGTAAMFDQRIDPGRDSSYVLAAAVHLLGRDRAEGRVLSVAGGPGNAMWIKIECQHATELFTAFGEKRVSSDQVAEVSVG